MSHTKNRDSLYKAASMLAVITILYNVIEGFVSIFFGFKDETIALLGFGLDSYVEVISGLGIWHLVRRLRENKDSSPDRFEQNALRITGTAFFMLAGAIILTSIFNLYFRNVPETTFWGIVVSTLSIISMQALIHYKVKVGRELKSDAILADANCTKACLYLSVILLISSAGYELTGIAGLDSIGAILIALLSIKEGREAFQKASGKMSCSCSSCSD